MLRSEDASRVERIREHFCRGTVTTLLEYGADPNAIPPYSDVRLIWNAVESCDIQAVRSLLDYGAKLDAVDGKAHTVLYKTFEMFQELGDDRLKDIGHLLVEHGATFNESDQSALGLFTTAAANDSPMALLTQAFHRHRPGDEPSNPIRKQPQPCDLSETTPDL